jgi:hypothetical protein
MASIMPEVVSHFACGRQRRILLKSKAGRILANDSVVDSNKTRLFLAVLAKMKYGEE